MIKIKIKYSNFWKTTWDSTNKDSFSYIIRIRSSNSIDKAQKDKIIQEINNL